ncbi:hypothetical protein WG66_011815 [Moniliophthora roreri]|nr:hypothetical protein WG66_011815 [Moniliophthora roreri]
MICRDGRKGSSNETLDGEESACDIRVGGRGQRAWTGPWDVANSRGNLIHGPTASGYYKRLPDWKLRFCETPREEEEIAWIQGLNT